MKYEIELNNTVANQEFDVNIEDLTINIHCLLQTTDNNALFMSVFVNNEQIGNAFMCFPNQFIIPFKYMENILGGNFVFETIANIYPNFENFGDTCKLYFVTLDELENAQ